MRTRMTLLLSSVALATTLAACGGGGVKKSAFTTKADGSCAAGNTAISGAAKPTNAPQVAGAAGTAATTIDGQVGALRAMKMPGGKDKAMIEGIITAIADVSAPTKALQDAAGKNDHAAMSKAAGEMQSKVDAAATQAQTYGLTQCGTALKPAVANLFEGTKSVVKSNYVTKGEAACRESLRKQDALTQPGTSLTSLVRYLDAYQPIFNKFLADFKAIPVPPGDESAIAEIVTGMDAMQPKIKEITTAAKANNTRLVGALFEEVDVASTQLDAKLDTYGLKACGSLGGY